MTADIIYPSLKSPHLLPIKNIYRRTDYFNEFLKAHRHWKIGDYRLRLVNKKTPFSPRDGAGAVYHNEKLFLIGGWNPYLHLNDSGKYLPIFPRITSNDVWVSSDHGITWKEIKKNSYKPGYDCQAENDWEGLHCFGCFSHNEHIYILGGDLNQGYQINDVWRSKDGSKWELVNPKPPWFQTCVSAAFSYRNYLYVICGVGADHFLKQSYTNTSSLWKSKDGKDWELVAFEGKKMPVTMPIGGSNFCLNGKIVIPRGLIQVNDDSEVWSSSGDLTNWELITKYGPKPLHGKGLFYSASTVFDSKLWVVGGCYGFHVKEVKSAWYYLDGNSATKPIKILIFEFH